MKAVAVYLKQKLKEQFVKFPLEIMTCIIACACCWSVGNHNNFRERYSDIQIFLNGDSLLNGSRVDLHGWDSLKWSCGRTVVVQGEKHQRSLVIRRENCVLKHCLSLKTFIPNFLAFFILLAVVLSCIGKMSFSVTSAKQEFMPAGLCFIIHLPGGGQCPLVRDNEPIRLLVIPTSPSLYLTIIP